MTNDNRTPAQIAEAKAFARKLTDLMARQGMSQSDVARHIWGTVTDGRGRDVAKNRDRISHYVRGMQMPEARTIKRLADVFGVEVADLVPALTRPAGDISSAEMNLSMIGGTGTGAPRAFLTLNRALPLKDAMDILAIVNRATKSE